MKFQKFISNIPNQELRKAFEERFDRQDNLDTVDNMGAFTTTLRLRIDFQAVLNMDFPADLRLQNHDRRSKLLIRLETAKLVFIAIGISSAIGLASYFAHLSIIWALVIASLSGTYLYYILSRAVRKSLEDYVENLMKDISGNS